MHFFHDKAKTYYLIRQLTLIKSKLVNVIINLIHTDIGERRKESTMQIYCSGHDGIINKSFKKCLLNESFTKENEIIIFTKSNINFFELILDYIIPYDY